MTSVRRKRRITPAKVAHRAGDRRLGAIGEVRMAADHAGMLREGTLDAFLELADAQHLGVNPDPFFGVGCLHVH